MTPAKKVARVAEAKMLARYAEQEADRAEEEAAALLEHAKKKRAEPTPR